MFLVLTVSWIGRAIMGREDADILHGVESRMTRAYELGQWASRIIRRKNRTLVGALALLLVAVVIVVAVIVASKHREHESVAIPAAVPQSKPSQEDIEKAAADRRAEAERQQEASRQRELEQQRAMARLKQDILDKSQRNVKACASIVRQRTDAKLYKGFSRFDAYVTGEYGETMHFFGTAEERFQFEKCMAERGVPLSKQKTEEAEK